MEEFRLPEEPNKEDRASRMELTHDFARRRQDETEPDEAMIAIQMGGVPEHLKEDPDELDEVQEQLRMDVREEVSEDDYEDESESEELLRRMPWLKYTAPEVLERASNRSYQYRGIRQRAGKGTGEESGRNPYEGEAFREAAEDLKEKIIEAKETAKDPDKGRVRDKVYIPPMHEKRAAKRTAAPKKEEVPPAQKPMRRAPVPFTSSAMFREEVPEQPQEQPSLAQAAPAAIDPVVKEEVRAFKQGILDLDEDDTERMEEQLQDAQFEAEEALAEDVIAAEGAERAFDTEDAVTQFAAFAKEAEEEQRAQKARSKSLTAMERLKELAQTDEVSPGGGADAKQKMTALDRLEQMEALERQGIPYAAQHRVGQAGFPAMQPMPSFPGMPMQGNPQVSMGGMMGYAAPQGMPMQPQGMPMQQQAMPMQPQMPYAGGMQMAQGQPQMPYGAPQMNMMQPQMGQTQQLPPLPPFSQMSQMGQQPGQPGQQAQAPQQKGGFDYPLENNARFDF